MICHQDLFVIGIWNKQIGFFFSTQQQNLNLKPNTLKNSNSFNCYSFSHFEREQKWNTHRLGKKLAFLLQNFDFSGQKLVDEEQLLFFKFQFFFTNFQNFNCLPKDGLTRKVKQRWMNWMIRYEHNRVRPKLGFETLLFQNFGCIKFVKSIFKFKTSNL